MKIVNYKNLIIGKNNNICINKKPKKSWILVFFIGIVPVGAGIYYWSNIIDWILKFL